MLKIVLMGYGKMGKKIEEIALSYGYSIHSIIDENNYKTFDFSKLKDADIAIEFTSPNTVVENIYKCFDVNLPIVVGTTGWNKDYLKVKEYCIKNKKTLFYASNFSIGVNIMFEINKKIASLINNKSFKINITETHHINKIDSPSGTAISLANDIIKQTSNYDSFVNNKKALAKELPIISKRKGNVIGNHTVKYFNNDEILEIKHKAKNRDIFANGALLAAKWLVGKKGFYEMSDLINNKK